MFKNMAKPNESIIEHTLKCYKIALILRNIYRNELKILDSENID